MVSSRGSEVTSRAFSTTRANFAKKREAIWSALWREPELEDMRMAISRSELSKREGDVKRRRPFGNKTEYKELELVYVSEYERFVIKEK